MIECFYKEFTDNCVENAHCIWRKTINLCDLIVSLVGCGLLSPHEFLTSHDSHSTVTYDQQYCCGNSVTRICFYGDS